MIHGKRIATVHRAREKARRRKPLDDKTPGVW
jgi:hypothetical protein